MRSVNSYSNTMRKEIWGRNWILAAIAFIAYFLMTIMPVLMNYHNVETVIDYAAMNVRAGGPLLPMIHCTLPVVMSVSCFGYLHDKAAVTVTHARPATRSQLFNRTVLYGYLLMMIPVILTAILFLPLAGAHFAPGYDASADTYESAAQVFNVRNSAIFIGKSAVIIGFVYAMSNLAAVIAGNRAIHALLALFINGFPIAITFLFQIVMSWAFYGYEAKFEVFPKLHPVAYAFTDMGLSGWIIFLVCIAIAYAVSLLLYRKVKLERVGDACFYPAIADLLCIVISFMIGVTLGLIFTELMGSSMDSRITFVVFTLIASAIGLIITRMIADSSVRVFGRKLLRTAVIYAVCIAVFFALTAFDVTGYQKRVPDTSKVASVEISPLVNYGAESWTSLNTEDSIADVSALHQMILANHQDEKDYYENGTLTIDICYHLKNGRLMERHYDNIDVMLLKQNSSALQTLDDLYRNPEYQKKIRKTIKESHSLKNVQTVNLWTPEAEESIRIKTEDYPAIVEAYTEDYLARSAADHIQVIWGNEGKNCWFEVERYEDDESSYSDDMTFMTSIDKRVTSLLKKKGYLE